MALRAQSASPLVGRGKTPAKGIVDRTGSPLGASKREEETDETEDEESEIARAESDDPDEWKTLRQLGVDGICTNRIAELATFSW